MQAYLGWLNKKNIINLPVLAWNLASNISTANNQIISCSFPSSRNFQNCNIPVLAKFPQSFQSACATADPALGCVDRTKLIRSQF